MREVEVEELLSSTGDPFLRHHPLRLSVEGAAGELVPPARRQADPHRWHWMLSRTVPPRPATPGGSCQGLRSRRRTTAVAPSR